MLSPKQLVDQVLAHEYDPAKRREYYLRTRDLKGRTPAHVVNPARPRMGTKAVAAKVPVKKAVAKGPSARTKAAQEKVAALQARLDKLREVLRELVKQAKARSGVDTKPTKAATPAKEVKLTAKQKADKAAAAKKAYEKANKPVTLTEQQKQLTAKIKAAEVRIKKLRAELAAAAKKAKARKTGSVGVRPKR